MLPTLLCCKVLAAVLAVPEIAERAAFAPAAAMLMLPRMLRAMLIAWGSLSAKWSVTPAVWQPM